MDQNYRMRKSVYIIPKKWTTEKHRKNGVKKYVKIYAKRDKASILLQKVGPKLQNASKRLYYCKELDQTVFLGHFFTQDRRPIGRHLPHLRLHFVGINRYAIVMFAAYAARKICRATLD